MAISTRNAASASRTQLECQPTQTHEFLPAGSFLRRCCLIGHIEGLPSETPRFRGRCAGEASVRFCQSQLRACGRLEVASLPRLACVFDDVLFTDSRLLFHIASCESESQGPRQTAVNLSPPLQPNPRPVVSYYRLGPVTFPVLYCLFEHAASGHAAKRSATGLPHPPTHPLTTPASRERILPKQRLPRSIAKPVSNLLPPGDIPVTMLSPTYPSPPSTGFFVYSPQRP